PVPGPVPGEHATRAVRSMGGRRQPHHEQLGVPVTEAGNGAAPIRFRIEGTTTARGHLFAPVHQARAGPAHAGAGVEVGQGAGALGELGDILGVACLTCAWAGRVSGPAGAWRHRGRERLAGARVRAQLAHRCVAGSWPPAGSVTSATSALRYASSAAASSVAPSPWPPAPMEIVPRTCSSAITGSSWRAPNGVMVPRA